MWLSFCKPDACSVEWTLAASGGYMETEKALGSYRLSHASDRVGGTQQLLDE